MYGVVGKRRSASSENVWHLEAGGVLGRDGCCQFLASLVWQGALLVFLQMVMRDIFFIIYSVPLGSDVAHPSGLVKCTPRVRCSIYTWDDVE